jgi:hypothetical protein
MSDHHASEPDDGGTAAESTPAETPAAAAPTTPEAPKKTAAPFWRRLLGKS